MSYKCEECGTDIPKERVEALIEITNKPPRFCVLHSKTKAPKGLMVYGHKTAGEMIRLPDDPEAQRQAFRAYWRSR